MEKQVTLRRNLEQVLHCVKEALSVVESNEDVRCAVEDIGHAIELGIYCRQELNKLAKQKYGTTT